MTQSANNNCQASQTPEPLGRGQWPFIDIHCHCLPGLDDGPATEAQALDLCRHLIDDGIGTVIATPHQLGLYNDANAAPQIRAAVAALNSALQQNDLVLTVVPGADVRVDERICRLLEADKVLTLADGGKYLLLELPHQVFIDIRPLLVELHARGIQAIISHPERHAVLARQPRILTTWLEHSCHLQVTAASLLGDFGSAAQRTAWHLLDRGLVALIATDCHDLKGRRPRMTEAFELINAELGEHTARLLCIENPFRILQGRQLYGRYFASTGEQCNEDTQTGFG